MRCGASGQGDRAEPACEIAPGLGTDVTTPSYHVRLAGILLGILALRLIALVFNRTELFFDEAQYWSWSLQPAFGYFSKPPLIAWIIGGMTRLCGDGEACIRAASPLLHTVTAGLLYVLGRRLYDTQTGFWSAVTFALLPGVSFSAGLISTDVPLLMCWAAAILALVALIQDQDRRCGPAVVLGLAVGIGLNAKYAMAFFVVCAALFLVATPERRYLLRDRRFALALAIAAVLIAPNLLWNARNGFATFAHTADNMHLSKTLFHPGRMIEFFLAQFAVFGPVMFTALLWVGSRVWRARSSEADRLLAWFAVPVLGAITVQALLSRANANWAAVAYVAGTVLVVANLMRAGRLWRWNGFAWLQGSVAAHVAVAVLLAGGLATAGLWRLPLKNDPAERVLGWRALGRDVAAHLEQARQSKAPYGAVLTDQRLLTASLLYYMRGDPTPVLAWRRPGRRPHDHYELTRAYAPERAGTAPTLLISLSADTTGISTHFGSATPLGPIVVPAGYKSTRTHYLFALSDYKGSPRGQP